VVKNMPSQKVLEKKQAEVAKLVKLIKEADAGVLVDYMGISVEQDTKLRKELREAGVNYFVEKNTLLTRAFNETGYEKLNDSLSGPTAFAVATGDQTAPARILGKFAEENENIFTLKAGFIGTEIYDQAGVTKLAKIPSKDVLLSQLVGSLQGPMQKLAALLKAVHDQQAGDAA